MNKITSSVRTGGLIFLLLVFTLSFIVASTNNSVADLTVSSDEFTHVSCFGENDGAINVTVSGGNSNYTYSWSGPSFTSSNEDISGLYSGTYTLQVSDTDGNSGSITIEITQPDELQISGSSSTDVLCNGESNGAITAGTVTGGNSGYEFSINGTTWQTSKTFSGLTANTYTIRVRDNKGCEASENVIVSEPDGLSLSGSSSTDVLCNGESNGTITAGTVTGGNSGYEFSINGTTWQTSKTFSGLTANTYTIRVRDNKGCEASENVIVSEPDGLSLSGSSSTDVLCNGESNGTITAGTVTGGNSGYEFSINGTTWQTSKTFSGLTANTYTVRVRDNKGCEASEIVIVSEPDVLSLSGSSSTDVLCNGESNGTITAGTVTGGNSGYEFSINGTTWQTSKTFSGLTANTYTIRVRDNKGCEASENVIVSEPDILSLSGSSSTDVLCNGESNGIITAGTVTGGNSGYEFSINGTTWQTSKTFSGLTANTYTVRVRDNEGCEASENIIVNEPDVLSLSGSSKTDVTCYGENNGTITAGTISGGNSGFQYSINGTTWQTSNTFSGLTPGNYTLRVRDNNGCETSEILTITQPDELKINNTDYSKPTCKGSKDGSIISIDVTGGTSGYQYKLNNGSYQNGKNFNGLGAGDHTIYVKDANNCVATKTITITEPEALALTGSSFVEPNCNGLSDGEIIAGTATGGTAPYEYKINGRNYQSGQTFTGFSSGSYTVTVKDASGCTASESVTITEPDPLEIANTSFVEPNCFGENTGTITAGDISGGTSPYQYKITGRNYQTSKTFENIAAGTYTITVLDNNSCESTETITVTQPEVLAISGSTYTPVSCNGEADGTVTAGTVSGGNTGFEYSIDGGTFSSTNTFSGLSAGNHTITVRDNKGCEATEIITVTQPEVLSLSGSTTTPVSCNGEADGTVSVGTVSGGNSNFEYSINDGNFTTATTFTGLSAGNHTITVRDNKGCEATEIITVTQPDELSLSGSTTTPVSCNGGSDGTATVGSVSGGNTSFEYSIDGGAFSTSKTFTGLIAGDHVITVRDNKGCEATETITVTEPEPLTATQPTFTPVSCNGGNDGTITAGTPSGGNGNYSYALGNSTFSSSNTFTNLTAGTYTLKIRDAKNCEFIQTIEVTEPEALSMTEPTSTEATCFGGNDGTITVGNMSGGNGNYQYSLDNTNFTTSTTFTGLSAGNYTIFVKDEKNCALQKSVSVSQPIELSASISKTNVSCYDGNDGTISLSQVTGGHGNYEFSVDGTSWQSETTLQNLSSGTYTVYIRDADYTDCEVVLNSSVEITQPAAPLTAEVSTTRTTSYGSSTGTATANATGGTPGYTYEWRNTESSTVLQVTKTATNLAAGDYELTVTDAKGCSYTTAFSIVEIIDATIIPTSICTSEEEDAIRTSYFEVENLTAIGGIGPYTYSWDFGDNATPSSATGAGSHEVNYSEVGNKVITLTVTDSENFSQTFSYTQFVGQCYRPNCVSNDFIATNYYVGDVEGNKITSSNCDTSDQKYIYIMLGNQSTRYSLYAELTYTITNLETGEITTYIENGCFYERQAIPEPARTIPIEYNCGDIVTLQNIYLTFSNNAQQFNCGQGQPKPKCYSSSNQEYVESPLFAKAVPNELLCHGDNVGTINVTASGGMSPYQYSITSQSTGYQSGNVFNNLNAGDYTVWVKDYNGEIYEIPSVTINQPSHPLTLETSVINPVCFGELGEASVSASGGTPFESGEPYQYLWNDASEQTTSTATGLSAGEYTITVIDANGCQAIKTVTLTQPEELTVAETGEDQIFGCGFNTTNLEANTPVTGSGEWTIVSGTGGTITEPSNPNSEFTGTNGSYTLRWTISHPDGTCASTSEMTVTFAADCSTLDFDGVDDHVLMGDNYPLSSGSFSIEVWVKPKSVSGVRTVLSKRDYSNINNGGFDLIINNGAPTFRWGSNSVSTSSKVSTDRWYHLAVIYKNSSIELYVDGIRVGNSSASNPASTSAPFLLGGIYDSTNPDVPRNYFHGWMEELRIWNVALSVNQLRFMMNQRIVSNGGKTKGEVLPMDVPEFLSWSNLKGYYRLMANEISNGETPDIANNKVNGILRNIQTSQENTAPLPYISNQNGSWRNTNTWLRPTVWDVPNGIGINGEYINWNIARISHDINSTAQDIYMLGLLSESGELTMDGNVSSETGHALTITHYLDLDGIIDLEGESQLVQTEGSILDENSIGYLDRDQQGTANSFNYNYWSSPVSIQGAANNYGYQIASILKDGTNPTSPAPLSFDYWYEYADYNYSGGKRISTYWLWTFRGAADEYVEWHQISETDPLLAGEGYTMKGTSGSASIDTPQNYVFRGKPNNGNILLSISAGENRLVGNPYPSAIDAEEFIRDNLKDVNGGRNSSNIFNGAVYFWDHFGPQNSHYLEEYVGGYGVFNLSGGIPAVSTDERIDATGQTSTNTPGRYIPVAQGFFVNAVLDDGIGNYSVSGGDIIFKNSQRAFVKESTNDSQFLSQINPTKSQVKQAKYTKDSRYKIRLHFASPKGYHREILVTADANTSNDFDLGYDAPLIEDNAEDMYWLINDSEFVIQAVPNFNYDQVLPIGMKISKEGKFSIDIKELENFSDVNIYLHDKKEDTYHNLLKGTFEAEASPGYINDRYEIVFKKPTTEEKEEIPSTTDAPEIYVDYLRNTKEVILTNPDLIEIEHVELFSMNGQIIRSFENIPTRKTISLEMDRPLSSAIYIVKVHSRDRSLSKKIIIKE
ncbi:LamG-like jellyroll fold domain-containing protein [Gramella sp. KN1008]|uniref:LamG-like jellyroll fold domain-containing protein n=1 Tax=Gramella sp. KN1008 TaxID=2529298 RepID=UPI001039D347|nr:LamG-like jellyroll fold domain-containing protein [Gramella sp. KN1008]TBW30375.1 T9SS type A sorting domain-containing protein [Gramella sp. KN1008]